MTRRNFIFAVCGFAASTKLVGWFPLRSLLSSPSKEEFVMRDGWILKKTDL